ncbi:bifunctional adenosylcobinamide kinase/adenosylcobinamide-phosphate guanylyltransferase [Mesobaculum littorinae]|uniref:Bifunctional adenosylcobalamin biosynthesis protein n=1 Tax=Mesobaculum littorinae TaxID=2486419 RepID=A0A438ADG6_9RHOB|nr:bifunctional adenosylcobinamide kinase/adenosylcobinamide-phosphate guanylyltransferase [Mesobaculum littorinae]RVV96734.1 bifunctional adenosylcobinamide kinase/adenosylcobinamide-phosphate guanylyltransferase [Mesobaculum littorinae]
MLPSLSFALGGAGSGKSAYAEALAEAAAPNRLYIASAEAGDREMQAKIAAHRARRGAGWRTVETPRDPGPALRGMAGDEVALFDCLTMWLANHLFAESDLDLAEAELFSALAAAPGRVIVVSNEVGFSIVPDNALARRFQREQARLNREIAARAGLVAGVMAGLPFALKGTLPELPS